MRSALTSRWSKVSNQVREQTQHRVSSASSTASFKQTRDPHLFHCRQLTMIAVYPSCGLCSRCDHSVHRVSELLEQSESRCIILTRWKSTDKIMKWMTTEFHLASSASLFWCCSRVGKGEGVRAWAGGANSPPFAEEKSVVIIIIRGRSQLSFRPGTKTFFLQYSKFLFHRCFHSGYFILFESEQQVSGDTLTVTNVMNEAIWCHFTTQSYTEEAEMQQRQQKQI